ncbi:MAG: glycosyltransferase family 4 protein [Tsuneonella sp.]
MRQGHEVTLFASGDSTTAAELVPCVPQALRLADGAQNLAPHHLGMIEQVSRRLDEFDIVHFHIDLFHYPVVQAWNTPTVTTLHGRLDLPELYDCYRTFSDVPLVSISDNQRLPLPEVNWLGTVPHGLPPQLLPFQRSASGHLVFLGRISPEKRPDRAIEIAVRSSRPLKIAAKIDNVDRAYWEQEIKPLVEAHDSVEFIGEVDESAKAELLGNAGALLFPIDWPEPFGLVMIEAMSCGTPVIAWRTGSVPEVLEDQVSGRIVESMDEAIAAVDEVLAMDRATVRSRFEARFTAARMAEHYVGIYQRLIADRASTGVAASQDVRKSHSLPMNSTSAPVAGAIETAA